jgi:hypothetical protein
MSGEAALERRYRRLLGWFPPEHQRVYGDEMVGVLLASAPENRGRPGAAETLDLIGAGLRTRLRRLRAPERDSGWSDALALFSVVAPFLMMTQLVFLGDLVLVNRPHGAFIPSGELAGASVLLVATLTALVALIAGPALARRGRPRATRAVAWVAAFIGLAAVAAGFVIFHQPSGWPLGIALLVGMEVLAIAASPGPRRGWELLRPRGLIAIGVYLLVAVAAIILGTQGRGDGSLLILYLGSLLMVPALALTVRWRLGVRLVLLLAIPGYPYLGFRFFGLFVPGHVPFFGPRFAVSDAVYLLEALYLPTLAIVLIVLVVAWRTSRRRPQAEPTGTGAGA